VRDNYASRIATSQSKRKKEAADMDIGIIGATGNIGQRVVREALGRGHRDALNVYRTSNRLWTYLSPAGSIYAGERTGRFRLGGDQLLVEANGRSRI